MTLTETAPTATATTSGSAEATELASTLRLPAAAVTFDESSAAVTLLWMFSSAVTTTTVALMPAATPTVTATVRMVGFELASTITSPAVATTLGEEAIDAVTVSSRVFLLTVTAPAPATMPAASAAATMVDVRSAVLSASMRMPCADVRLLAPSTDAFTFDEIVLSADVPAPARAPPIEIDAAIEAATATDWIEAISSASTVTPGASAVPAVASLPVTFLIDAEMSLAMVFSAIVAAIDTEAPTRPTVRASDAATASDLIEDEVAGAHVDVVGVDARVAVAVDRRVHGDGDAVGGLGAGAARPEGAATARRDRHRSGDDDGADALVRRRGHGDVAVGVDARVLDRRRDLGGVGTRRAVADPVGGEGDADRHGGGRAEAEADGAGRRHDRGGDVGRGARLDGHVLHVDDVRALDEGVRLRQDRVVGVGARCAHGDAAEAATPTRPPTPRWRWHRC